MRRFITLKIQNNVKLQNVVNRIDKDQKIGKQYKKFVNEFRNIHKNTYIEYDYQTYKNLILDRINKKFLLVMMTVL